MTERSGGQITFTEYFNAALSKPNQHLDTLSSGVADIATISNLYHPSQLPLAQVSYPQPFGPSDPQMVADIMIKLSEMHPEFYEEFEKNNVKVLGYKGNECYKIYSVKPLDSLDDLKGLKLGLGGVYYIPWFQAMGTAPVSTTAADTYQMLKTNVMDAMFCYDSLAYEYKWFEVADYIYNVEMGTRNNDVLCINLDTWNSLDAQTQQLLMDCADKAYTEFHKWETGRISEWEKDLLDSGMTQVTITDEQKEEWATTALGQTDTIQQWIDEVTALGYDGKTFMHDYLQIAQDMGFEWSFDISKY